MLLGGGQYGHVGRLEELLPMFKIVLVVICLHVPLVTSLEGKVPIFHHLFSVACVFIWDFFHRGEINIKLTILIILCV